MRESQQLFFGLQFQSRIFEEFQHIVIKNKIVQHYGGFFHYMKVSQPIGRKERILYKPSAEERGRFGTFLYLAAQNFELFSKTFRPK
jgi:hypothetical protein